MLDSLSKTMSRSSGLMANIKEKASTTISSTNSSTLGGSSSYSTSNLHRNFRVRVIFLDDTSHTFQVEKKARGSALFDAVFAFLELTERDYFGLVFSETGIISSSGLNPDSMRWLDAQKPLRKQLRTISGSASKSLLSNSSSNQPTLYFRVKFYVTDPSRIQEEYTRYHLYLQVKRDLIEGKLLAPISTICLLTSYAAQSSLGDYDPDTCRTGYLAGFRDLRQHCSLVKSPSNLTDEEIDRRITELHKLHKGQSPAEAEFNFLEHAKRLEMYGISLHNGKDSSGKDIQLGVTSIGLVVFQNQLKINTFSWSKIVKISFKRKQFFIQLRKELTESYDTLLGFNLVSYRSCKNLWKSAVEHHSFFRLHSPKPPPKRFLLSLGSKFRYSGRNEYQAGPARDSPDGAAGIAPTRGKTFPRAVHSRKTLPVSLESTSSFARQNKDKTPRLASPETSSIGSSVHSNGNLKVPRPSAPPLNSQAAGPSTVNGGSKDSTSSGGTGSTISLAHRAIESFNNKVQSLSTKLPKKAWLEEITSDDEGGFLDPTRRISSLSRLSTPKSHSTPTQPPQLPVGTRTIGRQLPQRPLQMSSKQEPFILPIAQFQGLRIPYADESSTSGRSSSVGPPQTLPIPPAAPVPCRHSTVPLVTLEENKAAQTETTLPTPAEIIPTENPEIESTGGLTVITIIPDEKGRFGFNVKGGADQKMPIIVSRVGANTPADKCYPKLNEGDQVVLINGRDVSGHTHDQVVNFIRASSEPHSGQLILAVRPNVYIGEDIEEPEFQYVPEEPISSPQLHGSEALLAQSMMLLEESVESGAIIGQFEQLARKNPGLSMVVCHSQENMIKNRYRDISPYDSTRVILKDCPTGDYINANHVNMTIPGSGIVNRYIATQGPLLSTCGDFWYMTWESQSNLIIMLTTIVERGRIKCHKYWPDLNEKMNFDGGLTVKCTKENDHKDFAYRDFEMTLDDEVRHVTQMAYLSWPDHGVPESSDEFVNFVEEVRTYRQGSICPTVVHCSAGIGRTGVLILMETALCLIEANQPVYPLDLTRQMRDQRASMIQTPSQYKFVCEAILRVFKEGRVKPLPEFCTTVATSSSKDDEDAKKSLESNNSIKGAGSDAGSTNSKIALTSEPKMEHEPSPATTPTTSI